jgi:hypothetical protein
MSERTIYTCDNCGAEGGKFEEFIKLTLSRSHWANDNINNYTPWGVSIGSKLFCKKCYEEMFGLAFNSLTKFPQALDLKGSFFTRGLVALAKLFAPTTDAP